jgi:hypothetical protein
MKLLPTLCVAASVFALPGLVARGDEPLSATAAFEKMKTLEGEWTVEAPEGTPPRKINYKVVGAGSALVEELFPGTDHAMVSVYYVVDNNLRLTHYCAAKNQPQLKLDRAASTPEQLVFAFDGGTNFDPAKDAHMHEGKIAFKDGGKVESAWTGYSGGKPDHTMVFKLSRP